MNLFGEADLALIDLCDILRQELVVCIVELVAEAFGTTLSAVEAFFFFKKFKLFFSLLLTLFELRLSFIVLDIGLRACFLFKHHAKVPLGDSLLIANLGDVLGNVQDDGALNPVPLRIHLHNAERFQFVA